MLSLYLHIYSIYNNILRLRYVELYCYYHYNVLQVPHIIILLYEYGHVPGVYQHRSMVDIHLTHIVKEWGEYGKRAHTHTHTYSQITISIRNTNGHCTPFNMTQMCVNTRAILHFCRIAVHSAWHKWPYIHSRIQKYRDIYDIAYAAICTFLSVSWIYKPDL